MKGLARDPKTRCRISLGVGIAILLVFFALSLEAGNWSLIYWTVPVGTVAAGIVYLGLPVLSANPLPEPWTATRKRRAMGHPDRHRTLLVPGFYFLAGIVALSLRALPHPSSWATPVGANPSA